MDIFKVGDVVKMKPKIVNPVFGPGLYNQVYEKSYKEHMTISRIDGFVHMKNIPWVFDKSWIELPERLSLKRYYNQAKEYKIVGRSKLNREGLIAAIQKYEVDSAAKIEAERLAKEDLTPLGEVLIQKTEGLNAICHWARQHENNKRHFYAGSPCHGSIMYSREQSDTTHVVFDISAHYNHHNNKELYKKFVEWMIESSPWAPCFITKDWEEALKGGIYADVDQPYHHIVCGAVALRQGSEFPSRITTWKWFLDKGYTPNVSWLMANFVYQLNKNWRRLGGGGGHDIFSPDMKMSDLIKFFNEGFHLLKDTVKMSKHMNQGYYVWKSMASLLLGGGDKLGTWFGQQFKVPVLGFGDVAPPITDEDVIKCADELKKLITT